MTEEPAPRMDRAIDFRPRQMARTLLQGFARTRAPLMADPRQAVMRAAALAMVAAVAQGSREEEIKLMALSTLSRHLDAPPSKRAASRREWATASALMADLMRLYAERLPATERVQLLIKLFTTEEERSDLDTYLRWWVRMETFHQAISPGNTRRILRAARWVLSKTRPLAQRVGYGKQVSPEESEAPKAVDASSPELLRAGVDGLDSRVQDEHVRAQAHGRINSCNAQAPP